MPYTYKKQGDQYCVYKKDGGKKVGCTDGTREALRKYMAALHLNANESVNELKLSSFGVKDILTLLFKDKNLLRKLNFKSFRDAIDWIRNGDQDDLETLAGEMKGMGVPVPVMESKEYKLRKIIREEVRRVIKKRKNG